MKATHSLITNSSLSHYIISTEKNFSNPIKINLETEIDLHLLFNKTTNDKEELWRMMEKYGFDNSNDYEDLYEKLCFEIQNEREIHFITADYNDEDPLIMAIARDGLSKHLLNKNEIKIMIG